MVQKVLNQEEQTDMDSYLGWGFAFKKQVFPIGTTFSSSRYGVYMRTPPVDISINGSDRYTVHKFTTITEPSDPFLLNG